jgi:MFS family permease
MRIQTVRETILHRFQPGVWLITLVGFFNGAAFSIGLPFLALYLIEQRGVSPAMAGVYILISVSVPAVPQLFGGTIADRLGRRPLLLLTGGIGVVLFTLMAVLIAVSAPIAAIVVMNILMRSMNVMQRPAINAMVTDLAPKDKLVEAFGLFRMGANLGWAAGPALGGFLAVSLSYAWIFGVGAGIALLTFLSIFFFIRESSEIKGGGVNVVKILSAGKDRNLLIITILSTLASMVLVQIGTPLSIYTVDIVGFTKSQFGFLLTLNGLMVVALQYPATCLVGRIGYTAALVAGTLFYGIGFLLMAWVGGYGLALGAVALFTIGEVIFAPSSNAAVGKIAPADWRGRYMGFYGAFDTFGMGFGILVGGLLLDAFPTHPLYIWGTIASIAFIAALGFLFYRVEKRMKK